MNKLDDLKHNLTEEKVQNEKVCMSLTVHQKETTSRVLVFVSSVCTNITL